MPQCLGSKGQRSRSQHDKWPSERRHTELNVVHGVLISSFCVGFMQHKGLPYCDIPCYCTLFGPHVYHQGVGGFEFSSAVNTMEYRTAESVPTVCQCVVSLIINTDWYLVNM